jgi:formyl-CoA transferase
MSATPGKIRFRAPKLGEHNQEILTKLGFTTEEIAEFKTKGAI